MKLVRKLKLAIAGIVLVSLILSACGGNSSGDNISTDNNDALNTDTEDKPVSDDPMQNKGIGPITSLDLGDIDSKLADDGKAIYDVKCVACHKMGEKFVGPDLAGVTKRRTPEWIMNMILNPTEMIAKDPIAKQLLGEMNGAQMANQNLTEAEARAVLEYFRNNDSGNI